MSAHRKTVLTSLLSGVFLLLTGMSSSSYADVIYLSGLLDSSQVVDSGGSTSTATGLAELTIDTDAQTITLDFSWDGLTGPADRAHLHDAPLGESRHTDPFDRFFDEVFNNNDALRSIPCSSDWAFYDMCVPPSGALHFVQGLEEALDLTPGCDPTVEVCSIAEFVSLALNDIIYMDIHTELYPQGEIRGQLYPQVVPEPSVVAVLGLAILLMTWGRRRRAR